MGSILEALDSGLAQYQWHLLHASLLESVFSHTFTCLTCLSMLSLCHNHPHECYEQVRAFTPRHHDA
jgi:hypothetical protein